MVWMGALVYGARILHRYAATPGTVVSRLQEWPAESRLNLAPDRPTLVLFLHPRCPCSRATLAELERFLTGYQKACRVYVVFVRGLEHGKSWVEGPLWEKVNHLEGVAPYEDAGGVEGGLFQAAVSGECFLFAPDGALLFHGGITPARGHEGNNRGIRSVRQLVRQWYSGGQGLVRVDTPVFGCSIRPLCTRLAGEAPNR